MRAMIGRHWALIGEVTRTWLTTRHQIRTRAGDQKGVGGGGGRRLMRLGHEAVSLEAGPWCLEVDETVLVVDN